LHKLAEVLINIGGCASGLEFVASTIVFSMSVAHYLHFWHAQLTT
jgi:hypothetical protein